MKTKITEMSYSDVLNLEKEKHQNPIRPNILFRTLLKLVGLPDLIKSHFTCKYEGMDKLGKDEPCIILMGTYGLYLCVCLKVYCNAKKKGRFYRGSKTILEYCRTV